MSLITKLTKDEECESVDSTKYRGMIGSLLYLTASRPDIMFSVCLCARFQEAPKTSHLEAVKRIFRYIKGTTHLGLWYPKGTGIETVVYADSDHAGDYVDRKSTSGICTFMGCCLTSWFSKKQTALAISTTEAEYVSAGKACQQALWMKQALIDYDAFRFYVIEPNESVSINSIIESRDAIFDENRFSSIPRPSQRPLINGTEDFGGSVVPEEVTEVDEPKTFDEATKSQDVAFWKEAINDEMDFILGNNTWVLADLPLGCKPLGCKWIFKRKLKVDGTIEKFKARLAIQGFRQKSRIDYFNTYALVARSLKESTSGIIHALAMKTSKFEESGKGVIICLYVDDMLIFGTDKVQVDLTKEFLSSKFSMKHMGEADVILGIRIKHESNEITISQSHYIEKVLKKFNYFDCTPISTPMDTSEKLMPNNGQVVSQLEYTSNPGTQHWQAIHRVLKYLKKTMDYSLIYIGYPSILEGYTDASWIENTEDNSSTSSWVFLLGGGAISRASKKQTCITSSIMESEFVALVVASKEAKWLRNLILDIILWSKPIAPISIICDSAATLAKAYS
ncbi:zinc finger, CCHC-type containing protein [Tanacetum coccineum]